jgi:hypothetical protein
MDYLGGRRKGITMGPGRGDNKKFHTRAKETT